MLWRKKKQHIICIQSTPANSFTANTCSLQIFLVQKHSNSGGWRSKGNLSTDKATRSLSFVKFYKIFTERNALKLKFLTSCSAYFLKQNGNHFCLYLYIWFSFLNCIYSKSMCCFYVHFFTITKLFMNEATVFTGKTDQMGWNNCYIVIIFPLWYFYTV